MTPRPPIPAPPYEGSCLCGQVRYAVTERPLGVNACHCSDCKKLTGATHLLMLLGLSSAFRHLQGDVARYRKTADSGREIEVVRCARCGVRLWHEPLSSPEYVFVAAGTLDDPDWVVPTSHIWTKRASAGAVFERDALLVEAQPGNRQMLFDAFAKVYSRMA